MYIVHMHVQFTILFEKISWIECFFFGPVIHWGPVANGSEEPSLSKWELSIYKDVDCRERQIYDLDKLYSGVV